MVRLIIFPAALLLSANTAPEEASPQSMRILVTNDDGIDSPGLARLVSELAPLGEIVVSAPATNYSGGSQAVTFFSRPIEVTTRPASGAQARYAVGGTPADAVLFGLLGPGVDAPFDLVVSGINQGENVGNAVTVSGTIGAARQAAMLGIPAIAVSQQRVAEGEYDYDLAARFTARLVEKLRELGADAPRLVSINVPTRANGACIAPVGGGSFKMTGLRRVDDASASGSAYTMTFSEAVDPPPGSDSGALAEGCVTVTALTLDQTDHAATLRLGGAAREAGQEAIISELECRLQPSGICIREAPVRAEH